MTRPYSECCRGSGRLAHIQICSIVSTASFLVSVHLLLIWISNYSLSLVLGRLFSCTQMFMECWNFLVTVRWLMIGLVHIILGNQSVQCLILKCIQVMISVVQTKQPCQCLVSMLTSFYSPPPPLKYRRYNGITLSVCPSVVLSMCPILSAQYLLKHSTIFYQTWYGGVLSQGNVSYKKMGSLSSMSKSQWRHI